MWLAARSANGPHLRSTKQKQNGELTNRTSLLRPMAQTHRDGRRGREAGRPRESKETGETSRRRKRGEKKQIWTMPGTLGRSVSRKRPTSIGDDQADITEKQRYRQSYTRKRIDGASRGPTIRVDGRRRISLLEKSSRPTTRETTVPVGSYLRNRAGDRSRLLSPGFDERCRGPCATAASADR